MNTSLVKTYYDHFNFSGKIIYYKLLSCWPVLQYHTGLYSSVHNMKLQILFAESEHISVIIFCIKYQKHINRFMNASNVIDFTVLSVQFWQKTSQSIFCIQQTEDTEVYPLYVVSVNVSCFVRSKCNPETCTTFQPQPKSQAPSMFVQPSIICFLTGAKTSM